MTLEQTPVLLLLHPTVVTDETLVSSAKNTVLQATPNAHITQHIIDRVAGGHVELAPGSYEQIWYVNPNPDHLHMPPAMLEVLCAALRQNGVLYGDLPLDQAMDALASGFIVAGDHEWRKPGPAASVSLLRKSGKKTTKPALFARAAPQAPIMTDTLANNTDEEATMKRKLAETKLAYFSENSLDDDDDDDAYVSESALIAEANLRAYKVVVPKKCELPDGKRRRKACKDCTCGLKELEEAEQAQTHLLQAQVLGSLARLATLEAIEIEKRTAVKFAPEELAEIDFTVQGKTGGCNSCALGDAFRCDGCPFLGLPPFKPGEPITLDAIGEDF